MARWLPPDNVGPSEYLGRRLFEEPMLRGAAGQPTYSGIPLHHFEEKRSNETSVDRLGATSIDRKVRGYLLKRADTAGRKFSKPKPFDGWAVVQAKHIAQTGSDTPDCLCVASPIKDPEPDDNVYHAHIARPNATTHYLMALHLRNVFTTKGSVEKVSTEASAGQSSIAQLRLFARDWWQRLNSLFTSS